MASPPHTSLPSIRELLPGRYPTYMLYRVSQADMFLEQFDVPGLGRQPPPPPLLTIPSIPRTLSSPAQRYTPPSSQYPSPISPPLGAPVHRSTARRNTIGSTSAPYPVPSSHSPTSPLRRVRSPPVAYAPRGWPSPPSHPIRLDPRVMLDPSSTLPSPPPTSTAPAFATFRLSPAPPHPSVPLPSDGLHSYYRQAAPHAGVGGAPDAHHPHQMRFHDPQADDPGSSSDTSSAGRHGGAHHGILLSDWDLAHSGNNTDARPPRRRRHEEERRHECAQCHKRFSRPSSLRIHENTHTGHKPFECPQPGCGRVFSVNSNMRRHYRTHAGAGGTGSLSSTAAGAGNAYPRIGDEDEDMSGSSEDEEQ